MFRSESQQNASRANGAKSRGPVTPEGKARSSQNGTRHGLFSGSILLQPESREAWQRLSEDLVERFQPADNVELNIIYDMAVTQWRKDRALNIEAAILGMEYQIVSETEKAAQVPGDEVRRIAMAWSNAVGHHKALDDLGKASIRLGNYWMRLHKKLKELQSDRIAAEERAEQAKQPDPPVAEPKPQSEPEAAQPAPNQHSADPSPEPHAGSKPGGDLRSVLEGLRPNPFAGFGPHDPLRPGR